MATVANKGSVHTPVDRSFDVINRDTGEGTIDDLTPTYTNELVQDISTGTLYRAVGPAATDWMAVC